MLDLHEGVREIFIEAQHIIYELIWSRRSYIEARYVEARGEQIRKWDSKYPEKRKAIKARWRAKNREKLRAIERERYWKKKALSG